MGMGREHRDFGDLKLENCAYDTVSMSTYAILIFQRIFQVMYIEQMKAVIVYILKSFKDVFV